MATKKLRGLGMMENEGTRRSAFRQLSVGLAPVRFGARPNFIHQLAPRLLVCDPCHTLKNIVNRDKPATYIVVAMKNRFN